MGRVCVSPRLVALLLVFALVYTIPAFKMVVPDSFRFKSAYLGTLLLFSTLSLLYLLLSMLYRGRVDYNIETVGLVSHSHTRRFCRKCDNFKPERAHHCSACGHCVKKMDHHCFWINNCVNYDNQGHFIRFLFFTALANLLVSAYLATRAWGIFFRDYALKTNSEYMLLAGLGLVSFALFCATTSFFYLQLRLAFRNTTFIEQLKHEDMFRFGSASEKLSPYCRGVLNNLKETLGSPYTLFLIGPFGDGVSFAKTYPTNYWPNAHKHYSIEGAEII